MNSKNSSIVLSFMGVDGVGKTTLINLLKKKVKRNFSKIRYIHLRPYFFLLDPRNTVSNPHKNKEKSFAIISFFKILYWLIVYRIYFIFLRFKKGELIIFDRYAHDLSIDKIRYQFNLSEKLTKLLLNFFPEPNLWVHLEASISKIEKRKKELPRNEIQKQLRNYRYFFKNINETRCITILRQILKVNNYSLKREKNIYYIKKNKKTYYIICFD